jgi:hypothetical protein
VSIIYIVRGDYISDRAMCISPQLIRTAVMFLESGFNWAFAYVFFFGFKRTAVHMFFVSLKRSSTVYAINMGHLLPSSNAPQLNIPTKRVIKY